METSLRNGGEVVSQTDKAEAWANI